MTSANPNHPTASVPVITDPDVLLQAMLTSFNQRLETVGELIMPAVPAMAEYYRHRIGSLFDSLAIPFQEAERNQLYQILDKKLEEGFALSPHARLRLKYHPAEPPKTGLTFEFSVSVLSDIEEYQEWMNQNEQPWFGMTPDAKVLDIAQLIEDPRTASVLDIGAATGRNTLTLAQRGYPVDALELVPPYCDRLQQIAEQTGLPVTVTPGDIFDPLVRMPLGQYQLAIATETLPLFCCDRDRLRLFLVKICDVLQTGGLVLFSLFLASDDYEPDLVTRQMSQVNWSCLFTRSDLAHAMAGLPLELISDESWVTYEQTHRPEETWPPHESFLNWATGRELLLTPPDQTAMELRWILCKRL
ncbi:class I SAM-dependent methyltransferase [Laspinema sp. D1]|uniref:class I SAM-dependent methyltransferase n=1 Tax=Laspinema palackyanum TaxID=3231601 RepID=UPI0034816457|nr:class I SAM-dependent methyltransferase [Laspinema sp. D2b]